MKVYIAGPMTGIPNWNYPAFDEAAQFLRGCGYRVVSPADLDRAAGFAETQVVVDAAFLRQAMARDLAAICECDGVALLEGWQSSMGACIEVALAARLGLRIIDAETLEDITDDTKEYIYWRMLA
jgi:hypothetical protein